MFNRFRNKRVVTEAGPGQWALMWERLRRNKTAMVALVVLLIIIFCAIFADVIADYETKVLLQDASQRLQGPSLQHWFGTDAFGRDLFARTIHGARYSLIFGVVCTAISLCAGCILGSVAAYFGGVVDAVIVRVVDAMMSIPYTLLALSLVTALGTGLKGMIIAIVVANVPSFTRMIRSVVLTVVRQDYIEAARASGSSDIAIIFTHVLPNAIGPIVVNATMSVAGLIMSAAGLSFIGMGIQPPAPEWGNMLNEAISWMRQAPHVVIVPGVAIIITALCFNLLGDGLTDALDPKHRV